MAGPGENAHPLALPNPTLEYIRQLPRLVLTDYVKSPPRFVLHFFFGVLLFYLQLQAGKEGKNQRWFRLGLLLATLVYLVICAVPTVIAFVWRGQGNQSISQLCCGFWLPYYYETRPQPEQPPPEQPPPQQPQPQLQQQLEAVHQAEVHLTIQNQALANAQAEQDQANVAQIQAQEALLQSLIGFHAEVPNIP